MNIKRQRFIDEYLKDPNKQKAAIRAGYSPKAAHVTASRLLKNELVRSEIERRQNKISQEANIDAAWVLKELGKVYESTDKPMVRMRALELMGKHIAIGAFDDKPQVNVQMVSVEMIQAGEHALAQLLERHTPEEVREMLQ